MRSLKSRGAGVTDSVKRARRYRARQKQKGRRQFCVPLRPTVANKVRKYADQEGLSLPDAVEHLLLEGLKRKE